MGGKEVPSKARSMNALFDDFWYFLSRKSMIRGKVALCILRVIVVIKQCEALLASPRQVKPTSTAQNYAKIKNFSKKLDMFIILW